MTSSAEKTARNISAVQHQAAGHFFRKAGEKSFFSSPQKNTFFSRPVQAKLTVSSPADPQEKEADTVAEKVMRMPDPVIAAAVSPVQEEMLQKKEEEIQPKTETNAAERIQCKGAPTDGVHLKSGVDGEESSTPVANEVPKPNSGEQANIIVSSKPSTINNPDIIQRYGRGPPQISSSFNDSLSASKGSGHALPRGTQSFMEGRFNADFSGVRVHTGEGAEKMNDQVQAKAFTHGSDIYFNKGQFTPGSSQGNLLLAHELTHTIQQGSSPATKTVARKSSPNLANSRRNLAYSITPSSLAATSSGTAEHLMREATDQDRHLLFSSRNNKKAGTVLRKSTEESVAGAVPELSGGYALPSEARDYFQSSFHADVGDIKIHTDFQAAAICLSKHVPAFTQGAHILFAPGRYAPDSAEGGALLARQVSDSLSKRGISIPGMAGQLNAGINEVKSGGGKVIPTTKASAPANTALLPKDKKKGSPTKEAKGKKGSSAGVKGKGKKQGDPDGRAFPKAKARPNRSPSTPQEDPAFHKVVSKAKASSRQQKQHESSEVKANEAQQSATAVPKEAESQAQNRKTGGMDEAGAKDLPFDAASFKADLLKKIIAVTPNSLEEATEFKENNKIGEVKTAMGAKVGAEKQNSTGPVAKATTQPLQVNEGDNKHAVPLPPTIKGSMPVAPSPKDAAPKNKLNNEISLQDKSKSLDDEMKANNVTEDQLKKSNEPDFAAALSEKKTAQKDAVDRPAQYRKDEVKQLAEAKSSAQETSSRSLNGMYAERGKNFTGVVEQQKTTKQKDEERRAEVSRNIEEKYLAAEKKVTDALAAADTESAAVFDQGSAAAQAAFENEVAEKMRAYKRRRYSGFWGGLRWAKDKLFGIPDEVNVFYSEGRQNYLERMDKVITQVASVVTTKLNDAKQAIKDGKKSIDDYVKKLPTDLADVGKEAASGIQDKFDSLEQSVNDKRDQLIDGLAKKYVDNVKKLDDRISEMKEANQGLVDKAIGFLKKVWKVIKDLTNLFTTILSKLASIIGTILSSPSGFFDNLAKAFKIGFNNFKNNFLQYLEKGLMDWLITNLGIKGIEIPEKFNPAAVFSLALQVMEITKPHIRERAVAILDEEKVSLLEGAGGLIYKVYNEGLHVIWEMIVEKLTDFKDLIWEAIKSFIQKSIIEAALVFILSMLNPIGAFIKVCMAIYDFLMMLVRFKDRIVELLDTVLNAVTSIASGAVDGAAKAIEGAFAKSIPVIIGFLAALLHLNNITSRVRDIILRVQKRVEKAIDWVILKAWSVIGSTVEGALRIKQKGKDMVEKGKQAAVGAGKKVAGKIVDALTPWKQAEQPFKAADGEHHKLYIEVNAGKPELMVASNNPSLILAFLSWWETRPNIKPAKLQIIGQARAQHKNNIQPLLDEIKTSEDEGKTEADRIPLLKKLLFQNTLLSEKVRQLMGENTNLSGIMQRYGLEGLTGEYSSLPTPVGDEFEGDHQPQASILAFAASLPIFNTPGVSKLRKRGSGNVGRGYAINLHLKRHMAGRTYLNKGKATKQLFESNVISQTSSLNTDARNRTIVVDLLKTDLALDVAAMRNVANKSFNDPVWSDVVAQGLSSEDTETLINMIKNKILSGESQIANQDMNLEN